MKFFISANIITDTDTSLKGSYQQIFFLISLPIKPSGEEIIFQDDNAVEGNTFRLTDDNVEPT